MVDVDVLSYVANKDIKWKFIVEHAPWMGGVYERLVGLVKRCLRKSLGRRHLKSDELATVLIEVEAIINSRPLVTRGSLGEGEALTPAHFLTLRSKLGLPFSSCHDNDLILSDMLSKVWKAGQKVLDQFWSCWQKEYLTDLRQSSISSAKRAVQREPSIGEIVLVRDENLPRGRWKLAVVIQTHTNKDGLVRSATVRLPSGKRVRRPMSLLYPLQTQEPQKCNNFIQDLVNSDQV